MQIVKIEGKSVFVSDTKNVVKFNAIKVMSIAINHAEEDEALDLIYKHSGQREKEQMEETNVYPPLGVFEEVNRENIPHNAVILPSKFVYAIKNVGTAEEEYKARYAAGGHRDKMKEFMSHYATNLKHRSVRVISSTSANEKLKVWSDDAKQAYIQCDQEGRYIVLILQPEMNLPKHVLLKLLKMLYGLSESGDSWNRKLKAAFTQVLKIIAMTGNQALYVHYQKEQDVTKECDVLIGTYVDELLCSVTEEFKRRASRLRDVIQLNPSKETPFVFSGVRFQQEASSIITLDQ